MRPTPAPTSVLPPESDEKDRSESASPEHLQALYQLVLGFRASQALYVVAKLGIADCLSTGPKDIEELAQATTSHAPTLFRLLRFLAGVGLFDYLGQHPDTAAIFQQAMTSNTARSSVTLTRGYDWSGIERLVDIGGGQGLLLATVLHACPTLQAPSLAGGI
jgi:hypothetical protein